MSRELSFPGFVDVHVHFRDPGVPEAETTQSGLAAARRGGFAAVVTMPNTSPAIDSPALVKAQIAKRDAWAKAHGPAPLLFPSACITKGRLGREVAALEALAEAGAAFFTDDGSYVSDDRVMEEAMRRAAALGLVVCDHALDPTIVAGGVIRDCPLSRSRGLAVIPAEAEAAAVRRDISLCRTTGCRLHIQHISTAQGVSLVIDAQREGLPVTAEATPHHLMFSCEALTDDDANFKMAPPLGNDEDRAALREAVKGGRLMFATDHAPHPAATKSRGFAKSANGITGLETALAATWSVMVEEEGMDPIAWARAWSAMPRDLLPEACRRAMDASGCRTHVSVGERRRVEADAFASLSTNSPYIGMEFDLAARIEQN